MPKLNFENSKTNLYACREGAFGRVVLLDLLADLVVHAHSETQFLFWLEGGAARSLIGTEVVEYSADIASVTNPFEAHNAQLLHKEEPALLLTFYLSEHWLDKVKAANGYPRTFPLPRVRVGPLHRLACQRIAEMILRSDAPTSPEFEREVAALIIASIDNALSPIARDSVRTRPPVLDSRLRAMIAYMRDHPAEVLSVSTLASMVGLSRAQIFLLFRDQLNTTPLVFWNAVRIEQALQMIRRQEAMTSLAFDLGFSTPGNFSRFFRDHMGVSPSGFKRNSYLSLDADGLGMPLETADSHLTGIQRSRLH